MATLPARATQAASSPTTSPAHMRTVWSFLLPAGVGAVLWFLPSAVGIDAVIVAVVLAASSAIMSAPSQARSVSRAARCVLLTVAAAGLVLPGRDAYAQNHISPVATTSSTNAAQLDQLVGPIALYPDDLVAIILPASTFPLEIVQAERFLDRRKAGDSVSVNEEWDNSVKSLLNYPDVVRKMSTALQWTASLGEAVVADQSAVLDAVQRFRWRAQAAGNLRSDDKQVVGVDSEMVTIVQADPQVIYVPQYDPATVVVAGTYPAWGYYPAPYPVYYYPYAPGAAFAAGLIWGAAITAAWNGGHYVSHYGEANISIDRTTNINRDSATRTRGQSGNQATQWRSEKMPGEVRGTRPSNGQRVGVYQRGGEYQRISDHLRDGGGGITRLSTQPADRAGPAGSRNTTGGDVNAFSGHRTGHEVHADSMRGASTRQSISTQSFHGSRGHVGGFHGAAGSFSGGGMRGGRR